MFKKLAKISFFLLPGVFYVQAHAYIYKCKKDGGIETDKTTYTKAIYTR